MSAKQYYTWVLGARGYIGSALVESLRQKSAPAQLCPVVHRQMPPPDWESLNSLLGSLEDFDFHWLERFPPREIYHCARIAASRDWLRARAGAKGYAANRRWREALQKQPSEQKSKLIYCSGSLVYGASATPLKEDAPLRPIGFARFYEKAERAWYNPRPEEDIRFARPAWILGPESWFYHFFYRPALSQGFVPCYGDGQQKMSLLHRDDCAGLLQHVGEMGEPQGQYNLYVTEAISQAEFTAALARKMGLPTRAISSDFLRKRYGRGTAEALCLSAPLDSLHQDWRRRYRPLYADLDRILEAVLDELSSNS